jgi:hypothetical protein
MVLIIARLEAKPTPGNVLNLASYRDMMTTLLARQTDQSTGVAMLPPSNRILA